MMRGRQIGSWISQRQVPAASPEKAWSSDPPPRRSRFWRIVQISVALLVIAGVAWWLRREGGYRRFISSVREGTVKYVEYQPYSNSAFVRVADDKGLRGIGDWLRDARPIDWRYGALGGADCEMRIVMSDGSTKHLWIGPTGPMRSGGSLVQSNTYILLKGDGWQRVGFSSGLSSVYIGLPQSAQLPFSSIPLLPAPPAVSGILPAERSGDGEVDASAAQSMMESHQLGAARILLAHAAANDVSDGLAQQLLTDTQGRINIRLPQWLSELQRDIPVSAKLDRERYQIIRERFIQATMMAAKDDPVIAELRKSLQRARPEIKVDRFREIRRLAGDAHE